MAKSLDRAVQLAFPIRGLNQSAPRFAQPELTSPELLNVWPASADGRLRGSQRPGLSKVSATQLAGPGGAPVQGIAQSIVLLNPNAIQPSSQVILQDQFAYNDGDLAAVSNNLWRVTQNTLHPISGTSGFVRNGVSNTTVTNALKVQGGKVVKAGGADSIVYTATYRGSFAPPAGGFVIRATVNWGVAGGNTAGGSRKLAGLVGGSFRLLCRIDPTDPSATEQIISLIFNWTGTGGGRMWIVEGEPELAGVSGLYDDVYEKLLASGMASVGRFGSIVPGPYTIELRYNRDYVEGYVVGNPSPVVRRACRPTDNPNATAIGFSFPSAGANGVASLDNFAVYGASLLPTYRKTVLVAVAQGQVYIGTPPAALQLAQRLDTASSDPPLSADPLQPVCIAPARNQAFIVDGGESVWRVDLLGQTVEPLEATAGSVPPRCQIVTFWRDRLVLAAPKDNPQNYFFSRQGNYTDWDYSQDDEAAAFAGNASPAHFVGQPITAIMPFNDDELLIGCDASLWRMDGDPRAGGSIVLVSSSLGVVQQSGWCQDTTGAILFVGTGGMYRIAPRSLPECISRGKVDQVFYNLNRQQNLISMQWDRDNQGAWLFIAPVTALSKPPNTGQDGEPGANDPKWKIDGAAAKIVSTLHPSWVANGAGYRWISTSADATVQQQQQQQVREYSVQFDLPAWVNASTVVLTGRFACDDDLVDVLLNGTSLSISGGQPGAWTNLTIGPSNAMVNGTNTLTFKVRTNPGPGALYFATQGENDTRTVEDMTGWSWRELNAQITPQDMASRNWVENGTATLKLVHIISGIAQYHITSIVYDSGGGVPPSFLFSSGGLFGELPNPPNANSMRVSDPFTVGANNTWHFDAVPPPPSNDDWMFLIKATDDIIETYDPVTGKVYYQIPANHIMFNDDPLANFSRGGAPGWTDKVLTVPSVSPSGLIVEWTGISGDGVEGTTQTFWIDSRTDSSYAFFPQEFPDNVGPVSSSIYDGDLPTDRYVMLGGRDGYIRKLDRAALSDDGVAISSVAMIGPVRPYSEETAAILQSLEVVLGEDSNTGVVLDVWADHSEYKASQSGANNIGGITMTLNGRRTRLIRRLGGGVFFVRLSNSLLNRTWSLEKLFAVFEIGGRQRLA